MSGRNVAGLAVWLVAIAVLALGWATGAKLGRPLYLSAGLIGGLAVLSAISSLWSGSVELSVTEADRVLVYPGFFLAAFLTTSSKAYFHRARPRSRKVKTASPVPTPVSRRSRPAR